MRTIIPIHVAAVILRGGLSTCTLVLACHAAPLSHGLAPKGPGASPEWRAVWDAGLPEEVLKNPDAPKLSSVYGEVNWGIAEAFEDDEGLEDHEAVFFKADFDKGAVPKMKQDSWGGLPWAKTTKVSEMEPVSGEYCGANTWGARNCGGSASRWNLGTLKSHVSKETRPAFFMRIYNKFDSAWYGNGTVFGMKGFGFVVQAVKHNAKLKCNGKNWFTSEMQFVGWGPSKKTTIYKDICIHGHFYAYMPYPPQIKTTLEESLRPSEYRFSAYANQRTWIHLDEWYCYEVAFYMNTPGEADGEGRYWVNGELKTHIKNMRYADTMKAFKVYAQIQNYRTQHDNTTNTVTRYVDNVVVANRYIGPIKFSKDRIKYFLDNGIVVHTGDESLTQSMRKERVKMLKDLASGRSRNVPQSSTPKQGNVEPIPAFARARIARTLSAKQLKTLDAALLKVLVKLSETHALVPVPIALSMTQQLVTLASAKQDGTLTFVSSGSMRANIAWEDLKVIDRANLAYVVTKVSPESKDGMAVLGVYLEKLDRTAKADDCFKSAGPEATKKFKVLFE